MPVIPREASARIGNWHDLAFLTIRQRIHPCFGAVDFPVFPRRRQYNLRPLAPIIRKITIQRFACNNPIRCVLFKYLQESLLPCFNLTIRRISQISYRPLKEIAENQPVPQIIPFVFGNDFSGKSLTYVCQNIISRYVRITSQKLIPDNIRYITFIPLYCPLCIG